MKSRERQRLKCTATRKDGKPCSAWAVLNGLCIGHQPNSNEARRKGGRNSSKKARSDKLLPLRLRPVLDLLEQAIEEVHKGKLEARQAAAMASLGNAITKVYEAGILEERLSVLEDRIR